MRKNKKPRRQKPKFPQNISIKASPKVGQVYWCDFPEDMNAPEFTKLRPVVIISRKNYLKGHVYCLPITTKKQSSDKESHKIEINGWVVCNHVYTFATRRLSVPGRRIPNIPYDDFQQILAKFHNTFPKPFLGETE